MKLMGVIITPAAAEMAPVRAKLKRTTRWYEMPCSRAAAGLMAQARTALPNRLLR